MKRILMLFMLTTAVFGQAGFQAAATDGFLANHTICQGTGCVLDNRVSMTTTTGFTSPSSVNFVHVNGKDYNGLPLGGIIFSTGSLLSGSLSSTAVFDVDQSSVVVYTNGQCGQFKLDGTCKVGGEVPNSGVTFVGVFEGRITWETNADLSHLIKGTLKGSVLGSAPVFLSFTCLTALDSAPFMSNGHLQIQTVMVAPF